MAKEKYSYGYANEVYEPFKKKESQFNLKLRKGKYYIIRFDGKDMTASFKIKHTPINELFFKTMDEAFVKFCKSTSNILFAYSFSDEISILLKPSKGDCFNNRIEKLLSLLSGKLALLFYHSAQNNKLDLKDRDWLFDARIIELNQQEVLGYFMARQAYAIDKYIMQLKGEYNIDYKLHTSETVVSELRKVGIDYNNLPTKYRYGLTYSKFCKSENIEFDYNKAKLHQMCFGK